MARLQDFQSVTPSSSDNLLIVQATGQGLANYGSTIGNKAPKSDLASISITGTTNNTGSTIALGTFFYLNGSLVRAITDIGTGASLTLNTNYERFSLGAFNRKGDDVYTLINNVTMTDTVTSYSTYGSRKISDFSYLLFLTGVSINDIRDTKIIPQSKWSSGKEVNGFVLHGSSSSSPADHRISTYSISYDSDTSIKASVGGSKVITNLFIYGIL